MFQHVDCPTCHKKTLHEVDKLLHYDPMHRDLTALMHCTECATSGLVITYDQYSPPSRR